MHYLVPTGSAHEQIEQPDWENCNYYWLGITGHWSSRDSHFPQLNHRSSEPFTARHFLLPGMDGNQGVKDWNPQVEVSPPKGQCILTLSKPEQNPGGKNKETKTKDKTKTPKTEAQPRGLEQNKPHLCQNASFQMNCQFFFLCSHT